jgi:bifunctional DNase/RNase
LLLTHEESGRIFPLWLGDAEASSVARALEGPRPSSPDTHDLMWRIVDRLGAGVEHVEIRALAGGVLEAAVALSHIDEPILLDARVSDAVALALRSGAPILVSEELLETIAGRVREAEARMGPRPVSAAAEPVVQSAAERWNQLLAHLGGQRPNNFTET